MNAKLWTVLESTPGKKLERAVEYEDGSARSHERSDHDER
jgi:hypothetical protein